MKLAALAVATSIGLGTAASAALVTIDFNGFTPGTEITGVDLGGVSITQNGSSVFAWQDANVSADTIILGNTSTSDGYRADFANVVSSVSVDVGDNNADADDLYLEAYDSLDNLIASDTAFIDSAFVGFETLSVAGTDIAYVIFGGYGVGGLMNVYADNLIFETVAADVPLPAGGALLFGALGAFGLARRKRTI
ncbi:hypothetical protein RGUI_0610 [Rhodovulum sp. P5]|uniref:VPLPA-CTERM sorting domain-containing protein n=1 Tax=Rhodovulum sp. P5 TaxID=1564506 RepID=UPI0009C35A5D|nr:VPLPA-CTERM sorting domain-containing protein [Rhodovulum sp. P5]ARE38751.1 hypothetical protein RGUI_0610 [Rhodovulum sp. P5]